MTRLRKRHAQALLIAISVLLAGIDGMAAQTPKALASSDGKPIALGAGPVSVTLAGAKGAALSAQLEKVAPGRKVYLVAKGLRTNAQPEALYQLYLGLPAGTAADPNGIHFVGSLNFFNAMKAGSAQPDPRFYSFDVTDLIGALRARKSLGDAVTVTVVPANRPNPGAKPQIGDIALVEQ